MKIRENDEQSTRSDVTEFPDAFDTMRCSHSELLFRHSTHYGRFEAEVASATARRAKRGHESAR